MSQVAVVLPIFSCPVNTHFHLCVLGSPLQAPLLDKRTFPSSQSWNSWWVNELLEVTFSKSLLKEGSSRTFFTARAQCYVTVTVVQTGPTGPLLQAATSQTPTGGDWGLGYLTQCYKSTGVGVGMSLSWTSWSSCWSISPVCVEDDLNGSSSILCNNYFPQFYVICELVWGSALTHHPGHSWRCSVVLVPVSFPDIYY